MFLKRIKVRIGRFIKHIFEDTLESNKFMNKKSILEYNILKSNDSGVTNDKYCEHEIIVSLTTYGRRLNEVHLTIESLMEQTMKANRIILWLDKNLEGIRLPVSLQLLQQRGLEIMYCDDIRSYKKLIPTLLNFPNDAIITADDDLIYEFDFLENLIVPYLSDSRYIYCHRYHRIKLDSNGNILPYNEWEHELNDNIVSILNFPTTGGGVLFPPDSLDKEVLNANVFMDICKYADDIWIKAMSLKRGTPVKPVFSHSKKGNDFIVNTNVQDNGLYHINVINNQNDIQLHNVFNKYHLYDVISMNTKQ